MAFSTVVETLLDHARSEARKKSSKSIEAAHLIAGLRRWKEEQFDHQFPDLEALLQQIIANTKGDSIETPQLEGSLLGRVENIKTLDQLWSLARELVSESGLNASATTMRVLSNSIDDMPRQSMSGNTQEIAERKEAIPLGSIDRLAERISNKISKSPSQVMGIICGDLAWIHSFIVGRQEPEIFAGFFTEVKRDINLLSIPSNLSSFISEIDSGGTTETKSLASQLAFAYADIAEWFAALDEKFEEVELERIDSLKERLIAQLGGVVDAEMSATQNFDVKFDALVGMQSVKLQLRKFVDFLVVQKRREKRGMKVASQRLHMAFLGNPGTGKTTVARLYGELLHELGLMNTTKFIEVAGTDFTGVPHIGESEPVMRAAVKDALNGVLFIDEAYSMNDPYNSDNKKGPGLKATDVLVKMMEDHRHELCVILAGYTEPTKEYLEANPGMPSRIGTYIDFPDYSPEDIRAMVPVVAKKKNLLLAEGSLERLAAGIEASRAKTEYGNARSVEKILEEAERNCVARVAKLGSLATNRHLSTIEPEDVPDVAPPVPKKTIGFTAAQPPGYL